MHRKRSWLSHVVGRSLRDGSGQRQGPSVRVRIRDPCCVVCQRISWVAVLVEFLSRLIISVKSVFNSGLMESAWVLIGFQASFDLGKLGWVNSCYQPQEIRSGLDLTQSNPNWTQISRKRTKKKSNSTYVKFNQQSTKQRGNLAHKHTKDIRQKTWLSGSAAARMIQAILFSFRCTNAHWTRSTKHTQNEQNCSSCF